MKIAFGAIFQNSQKIMDRFIAQFFSLKSSTREHEIVPLLVEGDSTDNGWTWNRLNEIFPGQVAKRQHGGTLFGQVDHPQRWMQVSYACDGVMERIDGQYDALLWIEADLIWEAQTILRLLEHLQSHDMVFPMVMHGKRFYDTWGFSAAGKQFANPPPYHPLLPRHNGNGLFPLDTGGACWAIRGDIASQCRFRPPAQAMRGFCNEVKKAGGRLWLDTHLEVYHP